MQKALFIDSKKGPWKVGERPIPKPSKDEVLVKIQATALNPVDWKIQKSGYFVENFPAVVGSDSSGIVEEIGDGVVGFKKGDRVVHQGWFLENDKSTFQQYAIVPPNILAHVPSSITFEQASTIPLGLATAVVALFNPIAEQGIGLTPFWAPNGKEIYKNKPIVIFGGSSSVGQYAIQVAKLSGFAPIITTSSRKHAAYLESLGANLVLDRSLGKEDLIAQIRSHTGGKALDVVYDAISLPDTQALSAEISSAKASIALTLSKIDSINWGEKTAVYTFGNVHAQRKIGIELYAILTGLLESGDIKPNRVEVLKGGLGAIPDGLDRMERNEVSGVKLVVNPFE